MQEFLYTELKKGSTISRNFSLDRGERRVQMKKLLCLTVALIVLMSPAAGLAQEQKEPAAVEEGQQQVTPVWEKLDQMQMALMLINKQHDYLLARLEEADQRVETLTKTYEERIKKEADRADELEQRYQERMDELETELEEAREQVSLLEKKDAVFNSENGVYLKIAIGFAAGVLAGLVLAQILRLWRAVSSGGKQHPAQS